MQQNPSTKVMQNKHSLLVYTVSIIKHKQSYYVSRSHLILTFTIHPDFVMFCTTQLEGSLRKSASMDNALNKMLISSHHSSI